MMRSEECMIELGRNKEENGMWHWARKVSDELAKFGDTVLKESRRWTKQSIYRVPERVKDLCRSAYEPDVVSLGPYHHGKQHLEAMEEHKQRAFLTLLMRSGLPVGCYVDALKDVVEDLKGAYHQLEPKWKQDTEAFLQLMIVDGCFLLEILWSIDSMEEMGYAENDPVFSNHGRLRFLPYLKRDMLMLENQLPPLLLFRLLDVLNIHANGIRLSASILKFFSEPLPYPHNVDNLIDYEKCLHILDLYRRSMILPAWGQGIKPKPNERCCDCLPYRRVVDYSHFRSATKLTDSGIRIEQSETSKLNDISFHGGVLKLPRIKVEEALESEYLNMIALERLCVDAGNEVTSLVFFMKKLMVSERDVRLLQSRGIIDNPLGSDKAVLNLFNSLSRDAVMILDLDSNLGFVVKSIAQYCETPLSRCIAYSNQLYDYLTNPWVGLSILAGVFLFALTTTQTVYTVLAYYHPK